MYYINYRHLISTPFNPNIFLVIWKGRAQINRDITGYSFNSTNLYEISWDWVYEVDDITMWDCIAQGDFRTFKALFGSKRTNYRYEDLYKVDTFEVLFYKYFAKNPEDNGEEYKDFKEIPWGKDYDTIVTYKKQRYINWGFDYYIINEEKRNY